MTYRFTETLGGLVLSKLGHVPTAGERVDLETISLEVLDVRLNRINTLRVTIHQPAEVTTPAPHEGGGSAGQRR